MSEVKKKKKLSTSAIVLIVSCIIIAIPIVVFLVIIITASISNNKPVLGNRFDHDLVPAITSEQEKSVENSVKALGVDNCEVVMTTAQFRVNVDAKDSSTKEDIEKLCDDIYALVDKVVPINTYFKMSSTGERMYDLEINVYNFIPNKAGDENWISYIVTKNSSMDNYEKQLVSEAKNPELARELRGEVVVSQEGEDAENNDGENKTSE